MVCDVIHFIFSISEIKCPISLINNKEPATL